MRIARSQLDKIEEYISKLRGDKKIRFIVSNQPEKEIDEEGEILIVMKITDE